MINNTLIRQLHRWVSMAFMVAVLVNLAAMSQGINSIWVGLLALVPLIVLMVSGTVMFIQPYAAQRRSARGRATHEHTAERQAT
jgi:hypothetical protein